ncbi:MAG: tetratricopeptide repeat protein [Proteobacteria bacterium]|nr:tetratricopeptide repeat protein [Pseudomonadota bacterium]
MHYLINQHRFSLQANQLTSEGVSVELTDKTATALKLFLRHPQTIISKDDFMQAVWGDVIVSDASLFKQIQICRTLLQQIGLPEDTIENVYGKGYRLKYSVKAVAIDNNTEIQAAHISTAHALKARWLPIIGLVIIAPIIFFIWQSSQHTEVLNQLSGSKKQAIIELSKSDWQAGLSHINNLIDEDVNYSKQDLGFLYQQQGQAQLELQDYSDSAQALEKSLSYFNEEQQSTQLGETHILLSRAYGALGQNSRQTEQVQKAVAIFDDSEDTAQAVDALMELAYLYKKSGDFELAINTYEQAADRAHQGDDPVGQMMAINNLAATYLVMNDIDKAQQLLQQGLDLSLDIGEGRYIASAYSMMSQIYLQKNQPHKAIQQIQEALKYQLKSNSGRGLNPKLMTLNYLLVVTFQNQQASELLQLSQSYVERLNQASPMAIVQLYQGMNLAHQGQWQSAASRLQAAWQASQVNNFSYQRPMLLAYFALSHARSEQPIKAIEAAQKVLALEDAEPHEQNLSKIALAWAYLSLENNSQYQQAMADINESEIKNWLFLAQQYWQIKLSNTAQSDLSYEDIQNQLQVVLNNQQTLSQSSQLNESVLNELKQKLQSMILDLQNNEISRID